MLYTLQVLLIRTDSYTDKNRERRLRSSCISSFSALAVYVDVDEDIEAHFQISVAIGSFGIRVLSFRRVFGGLVPTLPAQDTNAGKLLPVFGTAFHLRAILRRYFP
jgi:hypothetical protein